MLIRHSFVLRIFRFSSSCSDSLSFRSSRMTSFCEERTSLQTTALFDERVFLEVESLFRPLAGLDRFAESFMSVERSVVARLTMLGLLIPASLSFKLSSSSSRIESQLPNPYLLIPTSSIASLLGSHLLPLAWDVRPLLFGSRKRVSTSYWSMRLPSSSISAILFTNSVALMFSPSMDTLLFSAEAFRADSMASSRIFVASSEDNFSVSPASFRISCMRDMLANFLKLLTKAAASLRLKRASPEFTPFAAFARFRRLSLRISAIVSSA
mmetsp:Transcript_10233/g.31258  ORF Transcript_10233/g.31258 Transcript_10233/m.31258 type:complete len:268 (-) Transcript_10233:604-1407(-)